MTLVRPVGTILPEEVAMMSTWPSVAQAIAAAKNAIIVAAMVRPAGDAGVSRISRAAGRNSSSMLRGFGPRNLTTLSDFGSTRVMETRLETVKRGVTAAGTDQIVVAAVFDQATSLDGDDAVCASDRR